jgi:hypothetical protein
LYSCLQPKFGNESKAKAFSTSPNHIDIAVSLFNASLSYARVAGGVPRAYECACEALVIWQAALPPSYPHLQMGQENIRLLKLELQQQ